MEKFLEEYYKKLMEYFSKKSKTTLIYTVIISVLFLGIIDYVTGYEFSFSIFYLIPIVFVTWFVDRSSAIVFSVICAVVWSIADITSGHGHSYQILILWDGFMHLGFFLVTVYILEGFKKALERQKELARIDYITGVANARYFYEVAAAEINRSERYKHTISLAYLDIDNFKQINDKFGHSTGNMLLETAAGVMKKNIRSSDIVARLGGDEFAIYLAETNAAQAKIAVDKIKERLRDAMNMKNWPVTFSIGVVTCSSPGCSVDSIIKAADSLMYTVKNSGKNMVKYDVINSNGTCCDS